MQLDDGELARRAGEGERDAFAELVRRHHPALIRFCSAALGDASRGEDAAQEVFLKAFRALEGFGGRSAFATWLHRIAVNHCLDLRRAEARRRSDSLDAIVEREGERLERALGAGRDPAAELEERELADRLLSALPEEQRLALVLRETQGLSYEEIAAAMACSLDSVKARLRRARAALLEAARHFSDSGGV
ncbi:MAG: sigma-70 family RNA polymerase sigma factor [Elusimicrobia bacterium]|nr:sigma-70 family RNA polymerase sigma factor [Elusimicrobiota bacterium]